MLVETITLQLPEALYHRLANNARATNRSLEDMMLHALWVGSPPGWDDAPPEFQADLAEMDRLDDDTLWKILREHRSEADYGRYRELLEKNEQDNLSEAERVELDQLRAETDRFVLRKAHAAVLLRWRGYSVPIQ